MYLELLKLSSFNLVYMVVKLVACFALVQVFDWVFWPEISFQEELKKGNLAMAVFLAGVLGFAILSTSYR